MALDFFTPPTTPSNGNRTRARANLRPARPAPVRQPEPTRRPDPTLPRWRTPDQHLANRQGENRSQMRLLRALSDLPPARTGPVLRSGRGAMARPMPPPRARRPEPLMDRLMAGELHSRLVLSMVGVFIFVAAFAVLGGSFFL